MLLDKKKLLELKKDVKTTGSGLVALFYEDKPFRVDAVNGDGKTVTMMAGYHKEDIFLLKRFLELGAPLNQPDKVWQYTPLMHALAFRGSAESIQALLAAGADITPQGIDGNTALHLAIQRGDNHLMYALLKRVVSHPQKMSLLNQKNKEGFSVLMMAIFYNRASFARNLAKVGAIIPHRLFGNVDWLQKASISSIKLYAEIMNEQEKRVITEHNFSLPIITQVKERKYA